MKQCMFVINGGVASAKDTCNILSLSRNVMIVTDNFFPITILSKTNYQRKKKSWDVVLTNCC